MAGPSNPPIAQFPISPLNGQLPIVTQSGQPTTYFFRLMQDIYAAIQGTGGVIDLSQLYSLLSGDAEDGSQDSDTQDSFTVASWGSDAETQADHVSDQTLLSSLALCDSGDGSVSSVSGSGIVSVSPNTGNPVVSLGNIATNRFLANATGSAGPPASTTLTAFLDAVIGSSRGTLLVRGASAWVALPIGTSGQVLTSNGTDPVWT